VDEPPELGQGRENSKVFLLEHPDVSTKIENLIRAEAGLLPATEADSEESRERATADVTPIEKKTKGGKGG